MVQRQALVFCGGGTGGHIFPGLAVAQVCRDAGVQDINWIGDPERLEAQLVPAADIPLLAYGLSRPRILRPWWYVKALRLLIKTWRFLKRKQPRCIIASGGYAALLPGLLAPFVGCPLVVIEPNARAGKTNRLLALFAHLVVTQFPEARHDLCNSHVQQLGNPVRPIKQLLRGQEDTLRILVMGGSLSAKSINQLIAAALPHITNSDNLCFVHVAGKDGAAETEAMYAEAGVNAEVHAFVDDMPALYDRVDLAICRAGATSVAELCAAGIGALYIPLPWAADDHQTANARAVANVGGAVVLPQRQLQGVGLARLINRLQANREEVKQLGTAATRLARPDAAKAIWQVMRGFPGARHAVA